MKRTNDSEVTLTSCDQEKIHLITSIQSAGAFLAVSSLNYSVGYASDNAGVFFGQKKSTEDLIGMRLTDILDKGLFAHLQKKIKSLAMTPGRGHSLQWKGETRTLDVYIFSVEDGTVGLEFTPLPDQSSEQGLHRASTLEILNEYLRQMKSGKSLHEIGNSACKAVRTLTSMDRVMLYRFFPPSWYGEVIAEDKVAHAHSFMRHRFPASDIPKPARSLYLRNGVRLICDSHADEVPVHPAVSQHSGQPLDFSDSRLRSVSKIHLEYLRNMDVRGSFSVAIIVSGELWGLFACHHPNPIYVSHDQRAACQVVAEAVAVAFPAIEAEREKSSSLEFHHKIRDLFHEVRLSKNPLDDIFRKGADVNELFRSTGFALITKDGQVDSFGLTPTKSQVVEIAAMARHELATGKKEVYVSDKLSDDSEAWLKVKDLASGVLAVSVPHWNDALFILFRPELLRTIEWGGDPNKTLADRDYKGVINPRTSFSTWTEEIKLMSAPWSGTEIEGLRFFRDIFFDSLVRKEDLIQELSAHHFRKV